MFAIIAMFVSFGSFTTSHNQATAIEFTQDSPEAVVTMPALHVSVQRPHKTVAARDWTCYRRPLDMGTVGSSVQVCEWR